ncbi:SIR2 family protein [Archangium violaceum]|uniref:SIR2 family protein n=1 Tax=Archangium violaceum TaxID=83451 RepID=UPI00193C199A|nr:SIR2 family protein [Archangium violaceum]QRK06707.1 SIR2 family protein [Archangium violaceum]
MVGEIIDFDSEVQRHEDLLGREDILSKLNELLLGDGARGWVLVKGGPGLGKSALLVEWRKRNAGRAGLGMAEHFLRRGEEQWERPEVVRRNLAAQVERLYPSEADPEARPESRLRELLQRVSRQVLEPSGERLVLVVDGLDEAEVGPDGSNPLPRFLPDFLPPGVLVLCASRPTYPYLSWLEGLAQARTLDLDGEVWQGSNASVVRKCWMRAARGDTALCSQAFLDGLVKRSEGNALYTVKLAARLTGPDAAQWRARLLERGPEVLPQGLEKLLDEMWARLLRLPQELRRVVMDGLWIVAAAREALPLSVIARVAGWSQYGDELQFLREARPYLLEKPISGGGEVAWRPHHDSLRSYVLRMLGREREKELHQRLAEHLCRWPGDEGDDDWRRSYALRHGVTHWLNAGRWQTARKLYTNVDYLTAQCQVAGVLVLEEDLGQAAERVPQAERDIPRDLRRAIQAESHVLRKDPTVLARSLHNRLLCMGWSAEEVAGVLCFPTGLPALRLRRPIRTDGSTRTLQGHSGRVTGCAVTPDGRRVVSSADDNTLKVWELETGRELATLQGHSGPVTGCAVTPDGRRVVSSSDDNTLKVWELETGRELATLQGHSGRVTQCVVTPDGRCVVSSSGDNTLKVWELETRQELVTLRGHHSYVTGCAVTPDGRRMVSSSWDNTLKVWELETARELATLAGHPWNVTGCVVTQDGRRVVSSCEDNTLKVWELETGRELATLQGHLWSVTGCAVTPDGHCVVSSSWDNTLKVWELETGRELATLEGHSGRVTGCAVTPDGRRMVSSSWDNTLKVWELETGRTLVTPQSHGGSVTGCVVTPDGRRMVSSSDDNTLKVWELETGRELATLEGHSRRVTGCAVTPDGRRVVSSSDDNTLKVWELETGRELATLRGHPWTVTGCAVTLDGRHVVSSSGDDTLKVWELETGRELTTLHGDRSFGSRLVVTPDGRRVVSSSEGNTLKVWELETKRHLATLKGHRLYVNGYAVTPDGRLVVSSSSDRTLRVWELETGREVATLQGHPWTVAGCAMTLDGLLVVSYSDDNTLKVWDLSSGECLHTLYGYGGFSAIVVTSTLICAGDALGNIWFMEPKLGAPMTKQDNKPISPPGAPLSLSFPKPLVSACQSKKLALFIGSGLSMGKDVKGKFPSWTQLPQRLLDACEKLGKLSGPRLKLKREMFEESMSLKEMLAELGTLRTILGQQYQQVLNEIFRPHDESEPGEAHKAVAKLGVQTILTTNYDQLIESLPEKPRRQPYTWLDAPKALGELDGSRRFLLKVHGSAEHHESIVMTEGEYMRAHSNDSYQKVLGLLLQTHAFLFIGYGMNDPLDLDLALEGNAAAFKTAARMHYALIKKSDDPVRDQREWERYLNDYNVQVLPYDDHALLPQILDGLSHAATTGTGN